MRLKPNLAGEQEICLHVYILKFAKNYACEDVVEFLTPYTQHSNGVARILLEGGGKHENKFNEDIDIMQIVVFNYLLMLPYACSYYACDIQHFLLLVYHLK